MGVRLEMADVEEMVSKNPQLKIQVMSKPKSDTQTEVKEESVSQEPQKKPKRSKYNNKPVYVFEDGMVSLDKTEPGHGAIIEKYDSKAEYQRWLDLRVLEREGAISNLERQVSFVLLPGFLYKNRKVRPIIYKCDFMYSEKEITVVEDMKGFSSHKKGSITSEFELKWKMMKAQHPDFDLRIVGGDKKCQEKQQVKKLKQQSAPQKSPPKTRGHRKYKKSAK